MVTGSEIVLTDFIKADSRSVEHQPAVSAETGDKDLCNMTAIPPERIDISREDGNSLWLMYQG